MQVTVKTDNSTITGDLMNIEANWGIDHDVPKNKYKFGKYSVRGYHVLVFDKVIGKIQLYNIPEKNIIITFESEEDKQ